MLKEFHNWLLNWKPIHLCRLFRWFGWPIPKYFIGGSQEPELIQEYWVIGDDDNADPDLCTFDTTCVTRTNQAKLTNFMVRVQVANDGDATSTIAWQLYYNDSDDATSAVQVGAELDGDAQVDSSDGTPANGAAVDDYDVVYDNTTNLDWIDGQYDEVDGETGKLGLDSGQYTDLQFCVKFTALAQDEQIYYFFLRHGDIELDTYISSAKVSTPAAPTGGPRGPFEQPFKGPFEGPI